MGSLHKKGWRLYTFQCQRCACLFARDARTKAGRDISWKVCAYFLYNFILATRFLSVFCLQGVEHVLLIWVTIQSQAGEIINTSHFPILHVLTFQSRHDCGQIRFQTRESIGEIKAPILNYLHLRWGGWVKQELTQTTTWLNTSNISQVKIGAHCLTSLASYQGSLPKASSLPPLL